MVHTPLILLGDILDSLQGSGQRGLGSNCGIIEMSCVSLDITNYGGLNEMSSIVLDI